MASTRCMRCGALLQGIAQLCDDCVSRKREEDEVLARRSAERMAESAAPAGASPGICSNCGNSVSPGANFCPWCRTQLREDVPWQLRTTEYAGFWMRFLARIIDAVILGALGLVLGLVVQDALTSFAIQFTLGPVYTIGFWVTQGATPGKMALGVKLVTADGEAIGFGHAILRYFGEIACVLTLGIGYLMIAFTAEKRGLHDFIAGTMVVKTR